MNERIQDLVGQAKFMAEEVINRKISSNTELNAFAEKLAQLVIQECAEIAQREQAFNARYSDANQHPQVNIDQCILMRFGL